MKKLIFRIIFVMFLLFGLNGFTQTDCISIQCDCENIPDAEKDPGLIALCKYYENLLKDLCAKGESNLKCRDNAKGPNEWKQLETNTNGNKTVTTVAIPNNDTIDNLIFLLRNSDDKFTKYSDLYTRLENLQERTPGLALAMSLVDMSLKIDLCGYDISNALMIASIGADYSEGVLELILPKIIMALKKTDELEIDQIYMKYKLGGIFQYLKRSNYDILSIFERYPDYYKNEATKFINECYASTSSNLSGQEMKKLRNSSSRIYLRKIENSIPLTSKQKLTSPIHLISKDILEWNEHLINEALNALEIIAKYIEHKSWNKSKIVQSSKAFDDAYNNKLWSSKRYTNSLITISKELPIVWDIMRAIFSK